MSTQATLTLPTADGGSVELAVLEPAVYTAPPSPPPLQIPSSAQCLGPIEINPAFWQEEHDTGTSGTSNGQPPSYPSPCGALFTLSYTNNGGERWWANTKVVDTAADYFCYDITLWIDNVAQLAQLELDINRVLNSGDTAILGLQWSPQNGCWMYTTMPAGKATWNKSNILAKVTDFQPGRWYRIQLFSHHDAVGNVVYDGLIINGVTQRFQNAAGASHAPIGWSPKGLMSQNFQLDGLGASGKVNVYVSQMLLWRWTV